MMGFSHSVFEGLMSVICSFLGFGYHRRPRMQLNSCIASIISTSSLNQNNSALHSIANKFNINNDDGTDGLSQALSIVVAIKNDQNSLLY